jgi:hypothetical protein
MPLAISTIIYILKLSSKVLRRSFITLKRQIGMQAPA